MIRLTGGHIDVLEVLAAVAEPESGGSAVFVGTTRREGRERAVAALEYEAYEELALEELDAVAREVGDRHHARVAIVHRLGLVPVGEPTVVVAASARGRDGAFAASREVIDMLKARAPIWKRTVFEDGGTEWSGGA